MVSDTEWVFNMGSGNRPQEASGPSEKRSSPEQTHFTHPLSKHLNEHLLCVRPWGNRDEKVPSFP